MRGGSLPGCGWATQLSTSCIRTPFKSMEASSEGTTARLEQCRTSTPQNMQQLSANLRLLHQLSCPAHRRTAHDVPLDCTQAVGKAVRAGKSSTVYMERCMLHSCGTGGSAEAGKVDASQLAAGYEHLGRLGALWQGLVLCLDLLYRPGGRALHALVAHCCPRVSAALQPLSWLPLPVYSTSRESSAVLS